MRIREVMTVPAVTVTGRTSTGTALSLMHEEHIDSVPVVDSEGALIGAIDDTQLARDRRVSEIMTRHVIFVRPDDEIETAVDLMRSTTTEHLPVVEDQRVVGTICYSDLVALLAERQARPEHGPGELTGGTACSAAGPPEGRPGWDLRPWRRSPRHRMVKVYPEIPGCEPPTSATVGRTR